MSELEVLTTMCRQFIAEILLNLKCHSNILHYGLTAINPTDRPKSVRNRCVINVFGGVLYIVTMPLGFFSVGVGAFVIGLSQISSFFSY